MTADHEHEQGDDDRSAAEPARPAPSPERLIRWGSPPEPARPERPTEPTTTADPVEPAASSDPEDEQDEPAEPSRGPSAPLPPAAPRAVRRPRFAPASPAPTAGPAPSGDGPGTETPKDPPTPEGPAIPAPEADRPTKAGPVTEPAVEPTVEPTPAPATGTRRTWSSPTIAASPARERASAADEPPGVPPRVPRAERSRGRTPGMPDRSRGGRSSTPVPPPPPPPSPQPSPGPGLAPTPRPSATPSTSSPPPRTPAAPATPSAPAPRSGTASGRPVSITELAQQLSAVQAQLGELSGRVAATGTSRVAQQMAVLQSQLTRVGEEIGRAVPDMAGERRSAERTAGAITELSQQLAATQAQVASLSAQLTTLAHRITYDLERAGQATSERLVRDLPTEVAALVGPAIDDLTDQVEADRARLTEAVEGGLGPRLAALGEVVESLPLANVELMTAVQSLETDLEDRFTRLATRLGDQVAALEQSATAELARLREHVLDLQDTGTVPGADRDTIDRMAGQVERLSQRSSGSSEVVDAVELLIAEHLEVLRDDVETRVTALAPMLQEELEAVRAESVAGVGATEEALAERIDALEATLAERLDAAFADQIDTLDALVTERLASALEDLPTGPPAEDQGEGMAAVADELKALRRRITLRFEGGDAPTGLGPEQLDDLAELPAPKLHGGGAELLAKTLQGRSAAPPTPVPTAKITAPRATRSARKT